MSAGAAAIMTVDPASGDLALVEALLARDEATYAMLMDEYYGGMRRVAASWLRDDDAIDDAIQETWITVVDAIHAFAGRSSLRTWIYGILLNHVRRRAFRENRFVTLDDDLVAEKWGVAQNPDDWVEGRELLTHVEEAISALPHTQRSVITLRDIEGWTAEEVCDLLEISPANQRVLLHRARLKIRDALRTLHYFATHD